MRSILVFRTGQLGDTVVGLPAIHAIRERYPDYKLILLTPQSTGNLVSPMEVLSGTNLFSDTIFYIPPSKHPRTWLGFVNLALRIRRIRPDILFYLRDFPHHDLRRDKWFFQVLCGIRNVHGMTTPMMSFGTRDECGDLICYPSEAERLLSIVLGAASNGFRRAHGEPLIPSSKPESARIDVLLRKSGIKPEDVLIAIGPGSKMPAKRWPLDRFTEIGRTILAEGRQHRVVIIGGVEDGAIGRQIYHALGNRVVNVAGELSVLASAEVLRRCAVYVGNDSGAMHLAAAVGTPCVAIFSARDHPGRWDPWGSGHIVLRKNPSCAGCHLETCVEQDMACLKGISTGEVLSSVRQILARQSAKSHACVPWQEF